MLSHMSIISPVLVNTLGVRWVQNDHITYLGILVIRGDKLLSQDTLLLVIGRNAKTLQTPKSMYRLQSQCLGFHLSTISLKGYKV